MNQVQLENMFGELRSTIQLIQPDLLIPLSAAKRLDYLSLSEQNILLDGLFYIFRTAMNLNSDIVLEQWVTYLERKFQNTNTSVWRVQNIDDLQWSCDLIPRVSFLLDLSGDHSYHHVKNLDKVIQSSLWSRVSEFKASECGFYDDHMFTMTERDTVLQGLQSIDLSFNDLTEDSTIELLNIELSVQEINLEANSIGTAGALDIANSNRLENLQSLNLSQNEIKGDDLLEVLLSPNLPSLRELLCIGGDFVPADFTQILRQSSIKKLTALALGRSHINEQAMACLANNANMIGLERLWLVDANINSLGVSNLVQSPYAQNLKLLNVSNNEIDDSGAVVLANFFANSSVKRLDVTNNLFGEMGQNALGDAARSAPHRTLVF